MRVGVTVIKVGVSVLAGGRTARVRVGAGVGVSAMGTLFVAALTAVGFGPWQPASILDKRKIATSKKWRADRFEHIFIYLNKPANWRKGAFFRPPAWNYCSLIWPLNIGILLPDLKGNPPILPLPARFYTRIDASEIESRFPGGIYKRSFDE